MATPNTTGHLRPGGRGPTGAAAAVARPPTTAPTPMAARQQAVGAGVAVEGEPGQDRQDHLELVGQRADERHHQQRRAQRRRVATRSAGPRAPGPWPGRDRPWRRECARGPCASSGDDHGDVGGRVEQEARPDADEGDRRRRRGRARRRGPRSCCTLLSVMALRQQLGPDQLEHEGLARRVVDDGDQARGRRRARTPSRAAPTPVTVSTPRSERQRAGRRLRGDEQAARVDPVDDDAAQGPEQQHGQELQRGDEADGRCRESVSCSTSQPWATVCIHVPASETRLADEVAAVVRATGRARRR